MLDENRMGVYSKWIDIRWLRYSETGKTSVYSVRNNVFGTYVGEIKWLGSWRKYVFCPEPNTVFDEYCMEILRDFCRDLMQARKERSVG